MLFKSVGAILPNQVDIERTIYFVYPYLTQPVCSKVFWCLVTFKNSILLTAGDDIADFIMKNDKYSDMISVSMQELNFMIKYSFYL